MRATALILFLSLASAVAEDFTGRWEGSIQLPARTYDFVLDLERSGGKNWAGSVIIPGLDLKGAPLDHIAIDGAGISFSLVHALSAPRIASPRFEARLNPAGELTGSFIQAGNSAPFVVKKTGPAQVELPRQSTSLGKEWAGEWTGDYEMDGYPRHVTLTLIEHGSAPASAQLVVVGKRTTNAPVDLVAAEDDFLTIESHEIGITYEGRLKKGQNEIHGSWTLGPFELPLVLKRSPKTK
jgi:hypothetical protein